MLEAAVLMACSEAPRYGYELRSWLIQEELVAGVVSPGRLYETVANLVSNGALLAQDEAGERGPARRRYTTTDDGKVRLSRWVESLERSAKTLARFLERVSRPSLVLSENSRGGETMSCGCKCSNNEGDSKTSVQVAPVASERSIDERLQTIEELLQRIPVK